MPNLLDRTFLILILLHRLFLLSSPLLLFCCLSNFLPLFALFLFMLLPRFSRFPFMLLPLLVLFAFLLSSKLFLLRLEPDSLLVLECLLFVTVDESLYREKTRVNIAP